MSERFPVTGVDALLGVGSSFEGRVLFEVTVADRRRTVFVEFGDPVWEPRSPSIRLGDVWVPILSCRDWFGDELRDDLTAAALGEIEREFGARG